MIERAVKIGARLVSWVKSKKRFWVNGSGNVEFIESKVMLACVSFETSRWFSIRARNSCTQP